MTYGVTIMADTEKKKMYYDDFVAFMRNYTTAIQKRFALKKDVEGIQSGTVDLDITEEWIKSLFNENITKEKIDE